MKPKIRILTIPIAVALGCVLAQPSAYALDLPSTCIAPPATATSITGINTDHAAIVARYTLPDVVQACYQGYVDQGGSQPPERCIATHRNLLDAAPLRAEADCIAGTVIIEGDRTVLPAHADCASGGLRAIATFKLMCPGFRGKIEKP